jgi:hypothetical protein
MPSTYNVFERYGTVTPELTGNLWYGTCRYNLSPAIYQSTTNTIYNADATADYSTFSTTGITGFFDAQNYMYGVGSARYMLNGASPTPLVKMPGAAYYNTSQDTYKTGSVRIWSEHALQMRLDIQMYDGSGNTVGGTDSTTVTLTPNQWNTLQVVSSVNSVGYLLTLNVLNFNSATDTGKIFYLDQVSVENLRYHTIFQNAGARSAGQIKYTIPKTGPDYTALIWTVIGPQCSSAAGGTHPFFTLYDTSTSYATLNYQEGSTKLQAFKDDTDPNTDIQINAVNYNPGDVVFGALVNDGLTLTMYVAKAGDVSLQTTSSATEFDTFEYVYLGQDPSNSRWANSTIEQFLLYNRALTQAEVLAIFNSATPLDYTSDKRIIFAAATPSTLATYNGLGVAGTGSYRNEDITVSLDIVSAISSNTTYGPTGSSTHMFYGQDVKKLQVNNIISTGSNVTTSTLYKVDNISDAPNIGPIAYVSKI